MPHPNGTTGNPLPVIHTFEEVHASVGNVGVEYFSTTGERMTARQGLAGDRVTPVIILQGNNNVHGRVCAACWGFMTSCTGERIGQAVSPLDGIFQ